jgi:hypothetical protein
MIFIVYIFSSTKSENRGRTGDAVEEGVNSGGGW